VQAIKSAFTGKGWGWRKGDPLMTAPQIGLELLKPVNIESVIEAWQTDGAGLAVAVGIADFWGIGTQSYQQKQPNAKKTSAPPVDEFLPETFK